MVKYLVMLLDIQNTGNQTYEYNKAVYQNFDDADTRKGSDLYRLIQ